MSVVTGIMLCTSLIDESLLVDVDKWLVEQKGCGGLRRVEDLCVNGKHPEINMSGGGFNYFPDEPFAEFFMGLPWKDPNSAILILNTAHEGVKVYRPKGWEEYI